jgi:hypothetical protein
MVQNNKRTTLDLTLFYNSQKIIQWWITRCGPPPPPPLLFALSGRRKGHSFDHASRRGPPPCHRSCSRRPGGAKETCSRSTRRKSNPFDRASRPAPLPPLLFSGRREGDLFDCASRPDPPLESLPTVGWGWNKTRPLSQAFSFTFNPITTWQGRASRGEWAGWWPRSVYAVGRENNEGCATRHTAHQECCWAPRYDSEVVPEVELGNFREI